MAGASVDSHAAALRLDRRDRLAPKFLRRIAGPQEAAHDRDHGADRHDHLRVDDQPDEDARDARCKSDRKERGARGMRPVPVLGFRHRASPLWVTTSGFNPRPVPRVNDVSIGATGRNSDGFARSLQGCRAKSRTPPSGGRRGPDFRRHLDLGRPLPGALRQGPCGSRRSRSCRRRTGGSERGRDGRAGPSVSRTSRAGSTFAPTRNMTSS